jgi:hypothetical protein
MAFELPVFNLNVDVYDGPWLTKVFRLSVMGNLAFGRRENPNNISGAVVPGGNVVFLMTLLLPALTDIRVAMQSTPPPMDVLEVPSGSGRWYGVLAVEDIGKGFANEHRCASIAPIYDSLDPVKFAGLFWPTPMP